MRRLEFRGVLLLFLREELRFLNALVSSSCGLMGMLKYSYQVTDFSVAISLGTQKR